MISIVLSKGTLVNKLRMRSFGSRLGGAMTFILVTNYFVLDTVYFDLPSGASSSAKNLLVLYVAVPMFDTIGRNGRRSTLSIFISSSLDSLWIFAVP